MKKLLATSLLTSVLTISACSTVTPEQRLQYNQTQDTLNKSSVSILSMSCITKVEMGKDPILFQQAEETANQTSDILKEALESKNISVNKQLSPLVCGFMTNDTLKKMTIRYTAKGKREEITSYPILSTGNTNSEETNLAYSSLFKSIAKVAKSSPTVKAPIEISDSDAQILKKELDADKTFVLLTSASKPSFAVSMAVAAPTALLTGGTYVSTLASGQFYSIYLIDIENKQVEWIKPSTRLPGRVFKMPVGVAPIPDMLKPLYENK